MAHPRTFRFGLQASTAATRDDWVALARKVEDLGYSTLFMPDHFGDQLAPVPALMAAADATTELRIGALVFDNDYKHPVVLAKEAATLDVLSGGRLELGLGAGWMATDYEQSGIPYDEPKVRVDRFVEGLAVMKGLFAEGELTFEGRALHDQGPRRPAEAGDPTAPTDPDRRRGEADAVDRRAARPTSSASTPPSRAGRSTRPRLPTRWRARGTARWPG